MHGIRRIGLTYYVRFIIPKDRWEDCGRREVVRTLDTRDLKEARSRRARALEGIRREMNGRLTSQGLPPLDPDWMPSWEAEALRRRNDLKKASEEVDVDPDTGDEAPWGSPADRMKDRVYDRAEELELKIGGNNARRFVEIALGERTPIRSIADQWLRSIDGQITKQTAQKHCRALDLLEEFLVATKGYDPDNVLASAAVEDVTRRLAGDFADWLDQAKALSPKTIGNNISSLSAMWTWAEARDFVTGTSPWSGKTRGLKEKAKRIAREKGRHRAYTADELERLLRANPNEGRRWAYGAAIFDTMRLSLLTGARQNEICSLRRCDIVRDGTGMNVDEAVAKTGNSVREIPLHPLAQELIRSRLAALPASDEPTDPLFPELPPGGYDGKRSHRLALVFSQFRVAVLGEDRTVDFHSLRRTFATFYEHAQAGGVSKATETVRKDLMGHARGDVTGRSYIDRNLGWEMYVSAIEGVVNVGMPASVRRALEETMDQRPPLPSKVTAPPRPVVGLRPQHMARGAVASTTEGSAKTSRRAPRP